MLDYERSHKIKYYIIIFGVINIEFYLKNFVCYW